VFSFLFFRDDCSSSTKQTMESEGTGVAPAGRPQKRRGGAPAPTVA